MKKILAIILLAAITSSCSLTDRQIKAITIASGFVFASIVWYDGAQRFHSNYLNGGQYGN